MLGKFILWLSAIAFGAYGIACLLSPTLPAASAGLEIVTGDGYAEVGAMYGGLQIGFGLFCLLAVLRAELFRPGLLLLAVALGAVALSRLISTLTAPEAVGVYTWGALAYEFCTAIVATVALRSRKTPGLAAT